jgi:hypothetical protein
MKSFQVQLKMNQLKNKIKSSPLKRDSIEIENSQLDYLNGDWSWEKKGIEIHFHHENTIVYENVLPLFVINQFLKKL